MALDEFGVDCQFIEKLRLFRDFAEQENGGEITMSLLENKAHTATANRVAKRYGAKFNSGEGFDIQTDDMIIEVETTATVSEAVARLVPVSGTVYLAITNKDGVEEALRLVAQTSLGGMDAQGEIIKPAGSIAES